MEKIGIDVHKVATQVCILRSDGEFVEFRIRTERDALTKAFASRARARILLEAATESEWVARHLELLGHEVIVADPNFAPMYASRSRKVKRGHITKMGDSRMRYRLVECAWGILRRQHPSTQALREWALCIAARRGKRIAAVALARKLATILFAMTHHGRSFEPERLERCSTIASAA